MSIVSLCSAACSPSWFRDDLEEIKHRGELVLITRNNAVCYYEGSHGPAGFEYDLAKAFADEIGVTLRTLIIEEEADMVEALRQGKADMVAAGFPFGRQAASLMALGPGYLKVHQQVVGRRGGPEIKNIQDLTQSPPIYITGSSAHLELLRNLKTTHESLKWQILSEFSFEELLEMVWKRSVELTVMESTTLKINHRFFPELVVHLDLGKPRQLCWAMDPKSLHLQQTVRRWFARTSTQEIVQGLINHYFSHLEDFDYVDLVRYRQRIASRLPKYQPFFEAAAEKYHLDWQLVAAQAYQESHWDPQARSFTGVRGIMMLTRDTAKTLGLANRLEVEKTIFAGTRYFARLHRLIGDGIPEPDRSLIALAAYNVGLGHLQDARELAARMGKSGDTWRSVREILPLLQHKRYYRDLPHGYARGSEAVQYVDRIRTYQEVLNVALMPDNRERVGG